MSVIRSSVSAASDAFRHNAEVHAKSLEEVASVANAASLGGGEKSRQRHVGRGKMLPRERVANLLDAGSPFLEIGATAAHNLYDNVAPAAGVVAGIGRVHGQDVMVVCNDCLLYTSPSPRDATLSRMPSSA